VPAPKCAAVAVRECSISWTKASSTCPSLNSFTSK
jgi:hypothetical protein